MKPLEVGTVFVWKEGYVHIEGIYKIVKRTVEYPDVIVSSIKEESYACYDIQDTKGNVVTKILGSVLRDFIVILPDKELVDILYF